MTIDERIFTFVTHARTGLPDSEAKQISDAFIDALYGIQSSFTVGTAHTYLMRLRRALKAEGIGVPYRYQEVYDPQTQRMKKVPGYLREPEDKREVLHTADAANLEYRHTHACEIFPPARTLVDTAVAMLASDAWSVVFGGLLLLTGRRQYEIGVTAEVEPVASHPGLLAYRGQAKTRDSVRAREQFTIPVLTRATLVCEGIARLRTLRDYSEFLPTDVDPGGIKNSARFDKRTQNTLQGTTERYFNPLFQADGRRITPKQLRKLYGVVAYRYCREYGETFTHFLRNKLGHQQGSFTSVKYYEDYMPYLMQPDE